ncbi:hypothetical protein F53441_4145 [Fusarium austroafricanum]|uniref:Uncharacterized protein n=1 Tax=Fusarium austroafricanum TaxID=2364996 RepID=A0A8H4KPX3_9HYPO|nr:hypothetical protein F53441_4145 [Fusarium austroafricanum]
MRSSITLTFLAVAPFMAEAQLQKSTTKYSTSTVFLPQASTGSFTNIYASLITETGSRTEYLLACQTNVNDIKSCGGDFSAITVTYDKSSMRAAIDSTTYDCAIGSNWAACATITAPACSSGSDTAGCTATATEAATRTFPSSESSLWMTPITFVDLKKRKATGTKTDQPKETGSSGHCKRSLNLPTIAKRKVGHESGSDSGGSSGGSKVDTIGEDGIASDAKNARNPNKHNGDDCSAAPVASWSWGALALGFGGYLGLNLA